MFYDSVNVYQIMGVITSNDDVYCMVTNTSTGNAYMAFINAKFLTNKQSN